MRLRFRHLRHALALAEKGHYADAARDLGLSQPALTRSIQALESDVGGRLFDRSRSGVKATRLGELLLARGRELLAGVDNLERELHMALGLESGALAVGVGPYPAEISVGAAIGRLSSKFPRLKIDIRVGDWNFLGQLLIRGEVDIAVADIAAAGTGKDFVIDPLPRHHGYFVCRPGHPLTGRSTVTLDEVRQYPLVCSSLPERLTELSPDIRVDTFQLVRDTVLGSHAIGLAASSQVLSETDNAKLVPLPLQLPSLSTNYGFNRLRDRTPSPATVAFMEAVTGVEAGLAGGENTNES
jgi:DNA-binding transcriptional LysR family regulator